MAAKPKFEDKEVNSYIKNLTDDEFESFVSKLQSDFDGTIIDTFDLTSAQRDALSDMDTKIKEITADHLNQFVQMKEKYGGGVLRVSGLNPSAPAVPPEAFVLRCRLTGGFPWIECDIEITKD